jgi:hypothetical protein
MAGVALGSALLSLHACGGQVRAPEASPELVKACRDTAAIDCERTDECGGGSATLLYGSRTECITRAALYCEKKALSPGVLRSAADIETCGSNQQAQSCEEWIGILTPGCSGAGSRPNGSACSTDAQCKSWFCDSADAYAECGTCAPVPGEGDPCGTWCGPIMDMQCVRGRCVRLGQLGSACSPAAPCRSIFQCPIDSGTASGECAAASATLGETCDDFAGPFCNRVGGLFCDPASHTCAAWLIAQNGGACGTLPDGTVAVCREGACMRTGGATATCTPFLADGAPCELGPGTQLCRPEATCASGRCAIVGAAACD